MLAMKRLHKSWPRHRLGEDDIDNSQMQLNAARFRQCAWPVLSDQDSGASIAQEEREGLAHERIVIHDKNRAI